METIRFWYTFEDEEGQFPVQDTDISISCRNGLKVDDVCQTFLTFITAAGYSEDSIIKYFHNI